MLLEYVYASLQFVLNLAEEELHRATYMSTIFVLYIFEDYCPTPYSNAILKKVM